jgi:hypothetical protein
METTINEYTVVDSTNGWIFMGTTNECYDFIKKSEATKMLGKFRMVKTSEHIQGQLERGEIKPEFGNVLHIAALERIAYGKMLTQLKDDRIICEDREDCDECSGRGYHEVTSYECPYCSHHSKTMSNAFNIVTAGSSITVTCQRCSEQIYPLKV